MNKKKSETIMNKYNIESLKSIAADAYNEKKISLVSNLFSEEVVQAIMEEIKTSKNIEQVEIVWILVTGVLQRGGSNQKASNQIKYDFGNYSLTSKELFKIVRKHQKNGTNRQLARTICNDIARIALELKIPGDLHAQMRFEHPNLTEEDSIWCSNFQTTNSACPDLVRNWLVKNYQSRFKR